MLIISQAISTITLKLPILDTIRLSSLESWLRSLLWEGCLQKSDRLELNETIEIHRTKGLVPLLDGSLKVVQGVREIFELREIDYLPAKKKDDKIDSGKLIFIGRGLDKNRFQSSLDAAFLIDDSPICSCLASTEGVSKK